MPKSEVVQKGVFHKRFLPIKSLHRGTFLFNTTNYIHVNKYLLHIYHVPDILSEKLGYEHRSDSKGQTFNIKYVSDEEGLGSSDATPPCSSSSLSQSNRNSPQPEHSSQGHSWALTYNSTVTFS